MKPYYYVYNATQGEMVRMYDDEEDAQMKAEQLAETAPGHAFEILKCLGVSQANKALTIWVDDLSPM